MHEMSAGSPSCAREPIAVVGMGCRVPGADNVDAYWKLLLEGRDTISEVPPDRWRPEQIWLDAVEQVTGLPVLSVEPKRTALTGQRERTRWGGFLDNGDAFDAQLFGITAHEAQRMDPQQGLILEAAWHALEHAAIQVGSLKHRNVGVYIGVSNSDYDRKLCSNLASLDVRAGTGTSYSINANRISYAFGLRGPSFAVDAACSSSLIAIHLACQSLWSGETDMALAGGTHLILSPEKTVTFSSAGLLASDGRCKCFSENADGYVRGEGAGIVVLKRLDAAIRDGDRVFSLVLGSAVNHNGASNGLSGPSGPAQQELIRTALDRAGVRPDQIGYVEAHGSGTWLGDEIELRALSAVLSQGRSNENRFIVGSSKGNFGHLEAAAGVVAFIKTALILDHGIIPPTVGAEPINPRLRWIEGACVATSTRTWPMIDETRYAGVSSLSFGGANAHIVMRNAPRAVEPRKVHRQPDHARFYPTSVEGTDPEQYNVLTFSASSQPGLDVLAQKYLSYLSDEQARTGLFSDACFTAALGREALPYRMAIVAKSFADAAKTLEEWVTQPGQPHSVFRGHVQSRTRHRRGWLFGNAAPVDLSDAPEPVHEMYSELRNSLLTHHVLRSTPSSCLSDAERFHATVALAALIAELVGPPAVVSGHGASGEAIAAAVKEAIVQLPFLTAARHCEAGARVAKAAQAKKDASPQFLPNDALNGDVVAEVWCFCAPDWHFPARASAEATILQMPLPPENVRASEGNQVRAADINSTDAGSVCGSDVARVLAHAHVTGATVNWNRVFGAGRRVSLPLYPFERVRHWRTADVS